MRPGIATCSDSAWLGATAAMILKKFIITTKQMKDQKYSCPKFDHVSPLSAYMMHVVRKLPQTPRVLFTAVSTMNDATVLYSPSELLELEHQPRDHLGHHGQVGQRADLQEHEQKGELLHRQLVADVEKRQPDDQTLHTSRAEPGLELPFVAQRQRHAPLE